MIAFGANFSIALQIGAIEHGIALNALTPQPLRNIRLFIPVGFPHTRGNDFIDPAHFGPPAHRDAQYTSLTVLVGSCQIYAISDARDQ